MEFPGITSNCAWTEFREFRNLAESIPGAELIAGMFNIAE
jgi:hypothetical protein